MAYPYPPQPPSPYAQGPYPPNQQPYPQYPMIPWMPSPPPPSWMRNVMLVASVLLGLGMTSGIVMMIAGFATMSGSRSHSMPVLVSVGMTVMTLSIFLIYVKMPIALVWLYKSWSWLPPDQRLSRSWTSAISPGIAIGFLFIPYFQYYWMFVINCALADNVDRMQQPYGAIRKNPRGLAITAGILQFVFPPAAPFVWFAFMRAVDAIMMHVTTSRDSMMAQGPSQGAPAAMQAAYPG